MGTIDIKEFYESFKINYDYLYNAKINYPDKTDEFDAFLATDKGNKRVAEFVNYRGDFISSDREAQAFMLALYDMLEEAELMIFADECLKGEFEWQTKSM